jgi:hypothetical protein
MKCKRINGIQQIKGEFWFSERKSMSGNAKGKKRKCEDVYTVLQPLSALFSTCILSAFVTAPVGSEYFLEDRDGDGGGGSRIGKDCKEIPCKKMSKFC